MIILLAAVIPLLGYWANNLGQVRPAVVVRPLAYILLFTFVVFNLFLLILRSGKKTTLIMFLLVTLFFSFGNNVILLSKIDFPGTSFKSIYLLILYILLFLAGTFFIFRVKSIPGIVFNYLLAYTVLISIIHGGRIAIFELKVAASVKNSTVSVANTPVNENLPDVYYIVLDSYARNDILQEIYGFDNSAFLQALQSRGFYIPECANSNYDFTLNSVASVLNMDYLDSFGVKDSDLLHESAQQIELVLDNKVRHYFGDRGYQFVAARGFGAFNDIRNADIYLNYYNSLGQKDELADRLFFNLFFDTMLARHRPAASPMQSKAEPDTEDLVTDLATIETESPGTKPEDVDKKDLVYEGDSFWYHQTNYVFDSLAELPKRPGNYLIYAHINAPHVPYVLIKTGVSATLRIHTMSSYSTPIPGLS